MAARLMDATAEETPVLLRIDYATGHGSGASRSLRNALYADLTAFLFALCGR